MDRRAIRSPCRCKTDCWRRPKTDLGGQTETRSRGSVRNFQFRLCSGCGRWVVSRVFTLTASKRLLSTATGAGPNGGCKRYCGHRTSAALLALPHRPLSRHLDWRFRLFRDIQSRNFNAGKQSQKHNELLLERNCQPKRLNSR